MNVCFVFSPLLLVFIPAAQRSSVHYCSSLTLAPGPQPGLLSSAWSAFLHPFLLSSRGKFCFFFLFWLFWKLLCRFPDALSRGHHRISRLTPTSVTWHGKRPVLTHPQRTDHNTEHFVHYYDSVTLHPAMLRNDYKRSPGHLSHCNHRVNWAITRCLMLGSSPNCCPGMHRCRQRDRISPDTQLWARIGVGDGETNHICDTENVNSILILQNCLPRVSKQPIIYFQRQSDSLIDVKRSGNRIPTQNVAVYLKRRHDLSL